MATSSMSYAIVMTPRPSYVVPFSTFEGGSLVRGTTISHSSMSYAIVMTPRPSFVVPFSTFEGGSLVQGTTISVNGSLNRRHRLCEGTTRARLEHGDTIAVVGANGRVGRRVVSHILAGSVADVRALTRSNLPAENWEENQSRLETWRCDLVKNNPDRQVAAALKGANVEVIATGTSAFPTRSWGVGFRNNPHAVDRRGTLNILRNLDKSAIRRVVLVSSIGTTRSHKFPFSILNLFGVLNAKRAAEISLAQFAEKIGFSYAVIRPGRLYDEPISHPNSHDHKDSRNEMLGVEIASGDDLFGEISRESVARVVKHVLEWDENKNLEICIVNAKGRAPSRDEFFQSFANASPQSPKYHNRVG